MPRFLMPLLNLLRAGRLVHGQARAEQTPSRDESEIARQLCRTLDRAVQLGLWEHGQRIAGTAARLAQRHDFLAARIAEFNLHRGDPEAALAIVDSCPQGDSEMRFLRVLCLIQTGRHVKAHIDLFRWSREKQAMPSRGRLLLGLLEWTLGDVQSATAILADETSGKADLHTLQAMVAICTSCGRLEQAREWSRRLRRYITSAKERSGRLPTLIAAPAMTSSTDGDIAHAWLALTVDRLIFEALHLASVQTVQTEDLGEASTILPTNRVEPKPQAALKLPQLPAVKSAVVSRHKHRQAA